MKALFVPVLLIFARFSPTVEAEVDQLKGENEKLQAQVADLNKSVEK